MMEITAEIRALIDKAAAGVELAGDEYIDPADGLIHCKKCGGQRQTVVPCFGKPGYFMPRCICQCQREAEEQRKAAEERQRRMERIKRRKAQGLQDRYLYDYTFANDNGQNPLMDKAHAYVENWKEAYKSNIGFGITIRDKKTMSYLQEWMGKKQKLGDGRITEEEYLEWKLHWPEDKRKTEYKTV